MKVQSAIVGILSTNFYIITDEETGISAVVDPGGKYSEIEPYIKDKNVDYILITHGHYDHVLSAAQVKEKTGGKIIIGEDDADCLYDTEKSKASFSFPDLQIPVHADITVKDGDEFNIGNIKVKVMSTPGHSMGSVCYILPDEKVIFSGDTLFYRSAGRTDFPTSAPELMDGSLKKLQMLQGDYEVYPGHGFMTTLEEERKCNMFMR